ncbi:MAG TPA: trehalose-phosphatase [Candidatus Pristimantibacillus sp.]|nr:trehalose-phosphatase [Candidatus Pristimantibacillus sp.]
MTAHHSLPVAYYHAHNRLLLLDYDGTLADLRLLPDQAKPSSQLLELLQGLAEDDRNTIVVVSGRDRQTLEAWLGHLKLHLVAEHGYFMREIDGEWQELAGLDDSWKDSVRQVMDASTAAVPGSFTEEKATALVWHYRNSKEQARASAEAVRLAERLRSVARQRGITIIPGNKIVELRPTGVTKGSGVQHWLGMRAWDFVLAAGDDATDEDLFKAMPPNAFTIKIGPGPTSARERLKSPAEFLALLKQLI